MKIEQGVTNLYLSRKLKELGVKPKHKVLFYYYDGFLLYNQYKYDLSDNIIPAFLTDELLEILPEYVHEDNWFLEIYKDSSNLKGEEHFLVRYVEHDGIGGKKIQVGFNESKLTTSLARMVIYLIKNKLITV